MNDEESKQFAKELTGRGRIEEINEEDNKDDDDGEFMYVEDDFLNEMDKDENESAGSSSFKTMNESDLGDEEDYNDGDILNINE
jgi:hypothetical protein